MTQEEQAAKVRDCIAEWRKVRTAALQDPDDDVNIHMLAFMLVAVELVDNTEQLLNMLETK